MPNVVTILKGHITRISVDAEGHRAETLYARGARNENISIWLDDGSRSQVFGRGGAALVWESSDIEAQARQIAWDYRCRAIDETDVDEWASKAKYRAAKEEVENAWADAQWDAA